MEQHEEGFLRDFKNQMTEVHKIIRDLQQKLKKYENDRGSNETMFQKVLAERNFFRSQCTFFSRMTEENEEKMKQMRQSITQQKITI